MERRISTTCASASNRWRRPSAGLIAAVVVAAAACAESEPPTPVDPGLEGLAIADVNPRSVVPGTLLVVTGSSFVSETFGTSRLRLRGTFAGAPVDVAIPARFADFDRLEVTADGAFADLLGANGEFVGEASVEVDSPVDGKTHESASIPLSLAVAPQLTPRLDTLQSGGVVFVNDKIAVAGDGLLLGGDEGTTFAVVDGCFTPDGQATCVPVSRTDVPVVPDGPFNRSAGTFAFRPGIAGILPGRFEGTVELRNDHTGGPSPISGSRAALYDLVSAQVFSISPAAASLGQFVLITGGGFVGGDGGGDTLIQMTGTFDVDGGPQDVPVDLQLVPEFVDGQLVRYILNEDDALGNAIDLRSATGAFSGTVTPIVSFGGDEVVGDAITVSLRIAPVKQVVHLVFLPSYVESLRAFGLRAVDAQVRERVLEVARRDYATINIEFRLDEPTDFALFSRVEIAGPDPNGLGLLGYDNTPGKDTGNERLYDRIGGVNAVTQEDNFPGYGGVFIESLFGFSEHPGSHAESLPGADPAFDEVFDEFRQDRDGSPAVAADVVAGFPTLSTGDGCPADGGSRSDKLGCAVFVLGSLIGTTVSHEVGHSLGLANPFGEGFHNLGDEPNRLMDPGAARSFLERAQLFGNGPARFCTEEYDYLRSIMPTSLPPDTTPRPTCF